MDRPAMGRRRIMRSSGFNSGRSLVVMACLFLMGSSLLIAQEEQGFLGVELRDGPDWKKIETATGVVRWEFASPPEVIRVSAGSPAAQAGLRAGDFLIAINGMDITSEEGGAAFGAMRNGVAVEFRVRRGTRIANVTVTPGTFAEAFGEEKEIAVIYAPHLDSVKVQLKVMYEGLPKLYIALREAKQALARSEAEAERTSSEVELRRVEEQRAQIDSMQRQLEEWNKEIRVYTDSLAARTLYIKPRSAPEVDVQVVPVPEEGAMKIYSDAVAGARFKALSEDNPLAEYFGVKSGLLVTELVKATPAHMAGLREGDVVISVDGQMVHSVKELRKLLGETDEAVFTFVRKGEKHTCTIPSKKK
jgi:C-terminal processing protease CtpA/Prc